MITREQIFEYARSLAGVTLDCPFTDDFYSTVLRYDGRKWFGLLFSCRADKVGLAGEEAVDILNLKCEPNLAVLLREEYPWLIPAYHMNKAHWNTVLLTQTDDLAAVKSLIDHSYDLIQHFGKQKNPRK